MNARTYDPALGTFLSPDTVVPDAGRVSDYNRFLYARGNPLRYADPSGHIAVCFQGSPDTDVDENDKSALGKLCKYLGEHYLIGEGFKGKYYRLFANDADDKQAALEWIQEVQAARPDEPINLIGYSWGGSAALELAHNMNGKGMAVDALIMIDPVIRFNASGRVATGDEKPSFLANAIRYYLPFVPGNVNRKLNLWAAKEDMFFLEGRHSIFGATNREVEGTHHASIIAEGKPKYPWGIFSAGKEETVNLLTMNLAETWLKTGTIPASR
jgi:pimeloyl-ACP methyl ester carboxylesterase